MNNIFQKRSCISRKEMKAYLNNSMDKSTMLAIENHLLDCELCTDALMGIKLNQKILDKLPNNYKFQNNIDSESEVKLFVHTSFKNKYWLRTAAGLILLVGITALLWQYMNKTKNDDLYTNSFRPLPPISFTLRGENEKDDAETISEAMIDYGQKQYDKAIYLFNKKLTTNPQDNESQLYIGICYLETNQIEKAITSFEKVRINSEEYYNEAAWYLALVYIKENNLFKAEEVLNELVKNESSYQDKAKELLTRINQ